MNISLTPELETLVQDRVKTGMYQSASEVIREALRLLSQRDELRRAQLEELRKEIAIGIEQAERGEIVTTTAEELKAKARAARRNFPR